MRLLKDNAKMVVRFTTEMKLEELIELGEILEIVQTSGKKGKRAPKWIERLKMDVAMSIAETLHNKVLKKQQRKSPCEREGHVRDNQNCCHRCGIEMPS